MTNTLNNENAILPVKVLVNRSEKRLFEREALSVVELLEEVNTAFLYYLFDDIEKRSYEELFRFYADLWINTIDLIAKSRRLKIIVLDRTWFYNNYAPEI